MSRKPIEIIRSIIESSAEKKVPRQTVFAAVQKELNLPTTAIDSLLEGLSKGTTRVLLKEFIKKVPHYSLINGRSNKRQ